MRRCRERTRCRCLIRITRTRSLLPTTLIADGGGDAISTLFVTVLFAGIGALGFEYMATNKASPVPDPMFSGVYLTLQGVVASASKATGQAAEVVVKQVKDKLPI